MVNQRVQPWLEERDAPAHEALQADLTQRSMRGRIKALLDQSKATPVGLGALVGGFAFEPLGPAVPLHISAVPEFAAALLLTNKAKEPRMEEI